MSKTAWGKPTIKIGAPDTTGKTIPTQSLQTIINIKEDSTKLEVTEGDEKKLKGEGGTTLDSRRSAPNAELEMEAYILKDEALPSKLKDAQVSVLVVPEDEATSGLFIPMASVSIAESWSTAEGASVKIKFEPIKAKDASDIRSYYFIKSGAIYDPFTSNK